MPKPTPRYRALLEQRGHLPAPAPVDPRARAVELAVLAVKLLDKGLKEAADVERHLKSAGQLFARAVEHARRARGLA